LRLCRLDGGRAGDGNRQRASAECQIPESRALTTANKTSLSSLHRFLLFLFYWYWMYV